MQIPQQLRKLSAKLAALKWIFWAASIITILDFYTFMPGYGQSATPTPDIGTVPEFTFTPTPTLVSTPIPTVTPVVVATQPITVAATLAPTVVEQPVATSAPPAAPSAPGGAAPAPAVQPQNSITLTALVSVTTLNMRSSPALDGRVIDTLFRNDVVQVHMRNQTNRWWLVCCGNRTKRAGWIDATFLQPNFDRAQSSALLPVTNGPTLLSTTTVANTVLKFEMISALDQTLQGQTFTINLLVSNSGTTALKNVRVRDQLPSTLRYVQATADANAVIRQQSVNGGSSIISASWAQLNAGAQVTLNLTVQIDPGVPDGALIDNLAVVSADGAQDVTSAITLALPPSALPKFR